MNYKDIIAAGLAEKCDDDHVDEKGLAQKDNDVEDKKARKKKKKVEIDSEADDADTEK